MGITYLVLLRDTNNQYVKYMPKYKYRTETDGNKSFYLVVLVFATSSGNSSLIGLNLSFEPTFKMAASIFLNASSVNPISLENLIQSITHPSRAASRTCPTTVCSFIGADLPGKFYQQKLWN